MTHPSNTNCMVMYFFQVRNFDPGIFKFVLKKKKQSLEIVLKFCLFFARDSYSTYYNKAIRYAFYI